MEYITKETVLKMLNKIENAVEDGEGYQFNEWVGYVKELPTEWVAHKVCHEDKVNVLDKIRAEIEALPKTYPFVNHFDTYIKEDDVREIINKYKAESEEEE